MTIRSAEYGFPRRPFLGILGSEYGRTRQRQRDPSGSSLDILCLARDRLPRRVLCPSQTAYCCLAGAEWAYECLTSDLRIEASVE